jgi:hypothetical protein
MDSSDTVSRFLGVILTLRIAAFILGDTEAMVPFTMVPAQGWLERSRSGDGLLAGSIVWIEENLV